MEDLKCDYCKMMCIDNEIYRIKVQIPCSETKYWIDGIARIGLCQKCYDLGEAINELKTYFFINYAEELKYEVKKEPKNLYDTFDDFDTININYDDVSGLINNINLGVWLHLFKLIMAEIFSGNTGKIVKLMEIGMLSMDY